MKNNQIFSSKVYHLLYDYRLFLVEKWGALEVEKKYDWKNLLNLGCQDSKNHSGKVSPFHFLQIVSIETSNICFKTF